MTERRWRTASRVYKGLCSFYVAFLQCISHLSRCLDLQASPNTSVQEVVHTLTADYKDLELEVMSDDSRMILRHGAQKPDQLLARGLTLNNKIMRVYELVN